MGREVRVCVLRMRVLRGQQKNKKKLAVKEVGVVPTHVVKSFPELKVTTRASRSPTPNDGGAPTTPVARDDCAGGPPPPLPLPPPPLPAKALMISVTDRRRALLGAEGDALSPGGEGGGAAASSATGAMARGDDDDDDDDDEDEEDEAAAVLGDVSTVLVRARLRAFHFLCTFATPARLRPA